MPSKRSQESVVNQMHKVHSGRYDYDKFVYITANKKSTITCAEHGDFQQTPNSHLLGHGCPTCGGSGKLTTASFVVKANAIHNNKYTYGKVIYNGVNSEVVITCPEHGDFLQKPKTHLEGKGCKKCVGTFVTDTASFIQKATELHEGYYNYDKTNYTRSDQRVVITCHQHGDFEQCANSHIDGHGCPSCAGVKQHTIESFISAANLIHENKYKYNNVKYINNATKVLITCKDHGDFLQTPNSHLSGRGCPNCVVNNQKDVISRFKEIHGDKYDYSSVVYTSYHTNVQILCKKHRKHFWQSPANHIAGKGCPSCGVRMSNAENTVVEWFDKEHKIIRSDRTVLEGREIDILFPDAALGIEVDGVVWHSEKFKTSSDYHIDKTLNAKNKSVKLLHFWDYEINNKPQIVRSMIFTRLGQAEKIFARHTTVKEPSKSEVRSFLDNNHLQGFVGYKFAIGLYHNDELVSCMTFGKPRFGEGEWEMLRLATKLNIVVIGGASKMFKHFVVSINPKDVTSYADLRYSTGEVYNKLGFVEKHTSKPNFFYCKNNKIISRYAAQKHKQPSLMGDKFNQEISGRLNMLAFGYHRVYDCGNIVYKWSKLNADL